MSTSAQVDPKGPIFVSYAWEDGKPYAAACAEALSGVGVPVWYDDNDMVPGRFDLTIQRAAADGIAGVVLVVTPAVLRSQTIQTVEGPLWKRLLQHEEFILTIVNVCEDDAAPDYWRPDAVLPLPGEQLRFYKQYPTSSEDWLDRLVSEVTRVRVELLREVSPDDALNLELHTRAQPRAKRSSGHLRGLLVPPPAGASIPPRDAYVQLQRLTGLIPGLVTQLDRKKLRVSGGLHLSVAFAIGASVPTTSGLGLAFEDRDGQWWNSDDVGIAPAVEERLSENADHGPVAVLVDLVPDDLADDAFTRGFGEGGGELISPAGVQVLTVKTRERLGPQSGAALAEELARLIKSLAARHQTRDIHLCLRAPASVAALLGRHVNTLRVHLYEWERALEPARYVKVAEVSPGGADGSVVVPEAR